MTRSTSAASPAAILPISALCLPERLAAHAELLRRDIERAGPALLESRETLAQGFAQGLQVAKAITTNECEVLQRIYAGTAEQCRAQPDRPLDDLVLPKISVEGRDLVIRIDTDTLLHSVTMADSWPTDYAGQSLAAIVDRPLFVQEIVDQLQHEDEQGATPVHRLFDEAADEAMNAGSQAVEIREGEDE